jgi:hypothetical protein
MRKRGSILVAKRDGAIEPFDAAKPRRCLAAAMAACNCDPRLADALARAVELHLRQWSEPQPPTTDYVFRCLRTALAETGLARVAQRLIAHRQRRAAQRQRLAVGRQQDCCDKATPWRKASVAETLERRYGLDCAVARILAGEVERRVLGLEYAVVSTALINELIRSELSAWGLGDSVHEIAARTRPPLAPIADRQLPKEC